MSEDKPKGPDFTQGVPTASIAVGEMVAGRVGEDAVLIARTAEGLYAIGASCTHYHGPLAEGLIADSSVRCPWHHACFDLKTGEAIGAPAIDPVACWAVKVHGDKVFVTEKRPTAAPKSAPSKVQRVVIVGAGAAGFAAAEMLRRHGFAGDLTLLSADRDPPYDRPNCSKDFLAGKASTEWMPLRDDDFYRTQKIDLRLETEVVALNPERNVLTLKTGDTLPYDVLVLATGAEPQRPSIPGLESAKVHTLRSLRDAEAIITAAENAKRVAVIGASFIGLEAAAALRERGLQVHVIAPEATPLGKILGDDLGQWVKSVHEQRGVVFHLGRKVLAFADGQIKLDEGPPIAVDFVIVGTGVKPRIALAQAAGLKVDDGVVVDDRLRTSVKNIYAVGDIARYPDKISGRLIRVEHWVHAQRQGQHVARAILGADMPFTDPPFFWTAHYDKALHYSGHAEDFSQPTIEGSIASGKAVARYEAEGKLTAVATLDQDLESLRSERALELQTQAQ